MKRLQVILIALVITTALLSNIVLAQYNPQLGRFHQTDPFGVRPGQVVFENSAPRIVGTNGPMPGGGARPEVPPHVRAMAEIAQVNLVNAINKARVQSAVVSPAQASVGNSVSPPDPAASINTPLGIDPVRQYQDGMNLYEYVKSNPVNYVDPYGLRSCEINIFQTPYCPFGDPGHTWLSWEGGTADLPPDYVNSPNHNCQKNLKYIEAAWHTGTTEGGQLWHKDPKKRKNCSCASCDDITTCLRNYMAAKSGDFHWHILPGTGYNCRDFVRDSMKKCCLKRGSQWLWDPLAPITFCFSECGGKK